jgi:hypothetical protein
MKRTRVTPELAKEWLENQATNRPAVPRVIARYVSAMKDGKWITDEAMPLRFNDVGRLVDGQHRLRAVMEYGHAVEFYTTKIEQQTLDLLHECRPRTIADRLVIAGQFGLGEARAVAALGAVLFDRMNLGSIYVAPRKQSLSTGGCRPDQIMSSFEWAGVDAVDITARAKALYDLQPSKFRLLTPTIIGYLIAQDAPNAETLIGQLVSDEHPNREPSISVLRRQLGNSSYSISIRLALVSRAINHPDHKSIKIGTNVEDLRGGTFERMESPRVAKAS